MQKQTSQFAVVTENNVVREIGRSTILQPRVYYNGKEMRWYNDKSKSADKEER